MLSNHKGVRFNRIPKIPMITAIAGRCLFLLITICEIARGSPIKMLKKSIAITTGNTASVLIAEPFVALRKGILTDIAIPLSNSPRNKPDLKIYNGFLICAIWTGGLSIGGGQGSFSSFPAFWFMSLT